LFHWALASLAGGGCDPIVVVLPRDLVDEPKLPSDLDAEILVVPGAESRRGSVATGLAELTSEFVVVPAAVRPFATHDLVRRVVASLSSADAVVPVVPLRDTIKRVEGGRVVETVDRTSLCAVQTPQGFRTATLRDAHRRVAEEGFDPTDDALLIERYGGDVLAIDGDPVNMKITYPEDFVLAEAMARSLT
jgi:2-C-methyl-D-erythritol 4-phosphate cytidylyltransferase